MVDYALAAASDDPRIGVVDARFVKPLDESLILRLAREGAKLITIEDHALPGGFGSAVAELLADRGVPAQLIRLGIPDVIVPHGDPERQHEELGYGPGALRTKIASMIGEREPAHAARMTDHETSERAAPRARSLR